MAGFTENYHLKKPEDAEYYDVADFNGNMDIIDEALSENAGASEQLHGIISTDGNGVRVVKSIQRVVFSILDVAQAENRVVTSSIPIREVDPSRCIVLTHRIQQEGASLPHLTAVVTETALQVSCYKQSSLAIKAEFQIIEFY